MFNFLGDNIEIVIIILFSFAQILAYFINKPQTAEQLEKKKVKMLRMLEKKQSKNVDKSVEIQSQIDSLKSNK